MSFRRSPFLHIAIIAVLGLLVYSNTFDAPFVFDDIPSVQENPIIKNLSNIPAMFAGGTGSFASRPLMHATFALNYYFGGLDPTGYHAVNLVLHLINGVLLYLLVVMTGRFLKYAAEDTRPVALLASALFVAHPVQTEAVTYIVSRSMLLAAAFYLSGIMLFAKAATTEKRKWFYIVGLFIVSLLGTASRENFVTFPIMLVLYDLFFISGFKAKEALGRWRLYIPVLVACVYLIYLAIYNTYPKAEDFSGKGVPPLEYAITQLNVNWTYLRLLALPFPQNADYDYPTAQTLIAIPTVFSFFGYLSLWAGAIFLARKKLYVGFGMLWFLVAFLPISFMLALVGSILGLRLEDVIFEHRLYLPSVGVIAVFAALTVSSAGRLRVAWAKKAVVLCLVLMLSVLSVAAYKRNEVWRSGISLWTDVIEKSPRNVRAHNNIAFEYYKVGLIDMAVRHFETALLLDPDDPDIYNNMGALYASTGRPDKAIGYFEQAARINPRHSEAYFNLGIAYMEKGLLDKAIDSYEIALRLTPNDPVVHENLGAAYLKKGMQDKAQMHFRIAESLH